jgi:hypothetical protein
MKKISLMLFLACVFAIPGVAQNNFKIGIMASYGANQTTHVGSTNIMTTVYNGSYFSSVMGLFAEDGFNLIEDYIPDPYMSIQHYLDYATLCHNNNCLLMDHFQDWYRADNYSVRTDGYPCLNTCCSSSSIPNTNFDALFTNVYTVNPSYYFGHNLGSEKYVDHYYLRDSACPITPPPTNPFAPLPDFTSDPDWCMGQITPQASSDATAYFKGLCTGTLSNHKVMVGEAAHGGMITANYNQNFACYNTFYQYPDDQNPSFAIGPQHYIDFSSNTVPPPNQLVSNPTPGDIFNEASYFTNHFGGWSSSFPTTSCFNYLGKFGSMEYARHQGGYNEIFVELDATSPTIGWNDPHLVYNYHSNQQVQNNNLMRFYAYTSMIHKAHGIVFYNYDNIYDLTITNGIDQQNRNHVHYNTPHHADRYSRAYMPEKYQKFLSKLARELRYLVDQNYLSDNDAQVLYERNYSSTDPNYTQADPLQIVAPCTVTLPLNIPAADARDLLVQTPALLNASTNCVFNVQQNEFHNLRYVIRTNGTETIMIVSNPNPYSLHNISLNFNNASITNTQITNAKFVDVLFEDGAVTDVNSLNYRTDLDASVNPVTFTLNKAYSIPFCNKTITAEFGPFDTHIYHFRTTEVPLVSYQNGWQQTWTNNGNGIIGGWGTQIFSEDKFIPFDFDGNGDEELLCVQNFNSNSYCSIIDYTTNVGWNSTAMWTNSGSGNIQSSSVWTIKAGDRFIPGDFNGDGLKNELLCIRSVNSGAIASILKRNSSNQFYLYWTNLNGLGSLDRFSFTGWGINSADKYEVGDFNGDGKMNDLLCVQGNGTWWAIMTFKTNSMNFNWYWGNGSGVLTSSSVWSIGAADEFYIEDYNGDGVFDDVLCVNRTTGKSSVIYATAGTFTWQQRWTNGGNNTIGNWGGPIQSDDVIMAGNIDANDSKAELMFIQRCGGGCAWSMTGDFDASNLPSENWYIDTHDWVIGNVNQGSSGNFIDTWRVNAAGSARYILIRPVSTDKKYLLAFRDQGCNNTLISTFKVSSATGNYRETDEVNPVSITQSADATLSEGLHLFPNPTSGTFTVTLDNMIGSNLEIFDISGKLLYSKMLSSSSEEINPGNLAPGIYVVKASSKDKVAYGRLVVN